MSPPTATPEPDPDGVVQRSVRLDAETDWTCDRLAEYLSATRPPGAPPVTRTRVMELAVEFSHERWFGGAGRRLDWDGLLRDIGATPPPSGHDGSPSV